MASMVHVLRSHRLVCVVYCLKQRLNNGTGIGMPLIEEMELLFRTDFCGGIEKGVLEMAHWCRKQTSCLCNSSEPRWGICVASSQCKSVLVHRWCVHFVAENMCMWWE